MYALTRISMCVACISMCVACISMCVACISMCVACISIINLILREHLIMLNEDVNVF